MNSVTFSWLPSKAYICINYPWGERRAVLTRAFGTRRKAKKWARNEIDRSEFGIMVFGPIGARLVLESRDLAKRTDGTFMGSVTVDDEHWFDVSGPTLDEAYASLLKTRFDIAHKIREVGLEATKALYRNQIAAGVV